MGQNDGSITLINDSRVMLQIVVSLKTRVLIYVDNMFIAQSTMA